MPPPYGRDCHTGNGCHTVGMSPSLRQERRAHTGAVIAASALELFTRRTFAEVTMAEIAAAAGVGERTLYRYFADKEELLFGEDEAFRERLGLAVVRRSPGEQPLTALRAASIELATFLEGRREHVRRRAAVIAGTPALLARERAKHAAWEAVLANALAERGVSSNQARLLGRVTVACYDEAMARWLERATGVRTLAAALEQAFDDVVDLSRLS